MILRDIPDPHEKIDSLIEAFGIDATLEYFHHLDSRNKLNKPYSYEMAADYVSGKYPDEFIIWKLTNDFS